MTIKEARQEAKLSQQTMSSLLKIPKRTLEDWEMGKRTPSEWAESLIIEKLKILKGAYVMLKIIDHWTEENIESYTKLLGEAMSQEPTEIDFEGKKYTGYVFGTDEMYEGNDFYQLVYCNGKIYKAYYDTTDEDGEEYLDLTLIDYTTPFGFERCEDFEVVAEI